MANVGEVHDAKAARWSGLVDTVINSSDRQTDKVVREIKESGKEVDAVNDLVFLLRFNGEIDRSRRGLTLVALHDRGVDILDAVGKGLLIKTGGGDKACVDVMARIGPAAFPLIAGILDGSKLTEWRETDSEIAKRKIDPRDEEDLVRNAIYALSYMNKYYTAAEIQTDPNYQAIDKLLLERAMLSDNRIISYRSIDLLARMAYPGSTRALFEYATTLNLDNPQDQSRRDYTRNRLEEVTSGTGNRVVLNMLNSAVYEQTIYGIYFAGVYKLGLFVPALSSLLNVHEGNIAQSAGIALLAAFHKDQARETRAAILEAFKDAPTYYAEVFKKYMAWNMKGVDLDELLFVLDKIRVHGGEDIYDQLEVYSQRLAAKGDAMVDSRLKSALYGAMAEVLARSGK